RRNLESADDVFRSGPSSASGSKKTVTASSNETPCFAALASAFRGSHSNTYLVYTECRGMLRVTDQGGRPPCHTPGSTCGRRNVCLATDSVGCRSLESPSGRRRGEL